MQLLVKVLGLRTFGYADYLLFVGIGREKTEALGNLWSLVTAVHLDWRINLTGTWNDFPLYTLPEERPVNPHGMPS